MYLFIGFEGENLDGTENLDLRIFVISSYNEKAFKIREQMAAKIK